MYPEIVVLILLILLFYQRNIWKEMMVGFGRGFPEVGDSRVYPNRFDAAPYGPYPWADPQWS